MYRLTYKKHGEGGEYTFHISGVETDEEAARECRRYMDASEKKHGKVFIWGKFERINKPEKTTTLNVDKLHSRVTP